jgi:amino acid adenylation domain-containing protein
VALRSDLGGNPSFLELLEQVRQTTLSAYAHQDTPFEKVVEAVVNHRDLSRSPLFQVVFVLQNMPEIPTLGLAGAEVSLADMGHRTSKFDVIFTVNETGAHLSLSIEYSTDLFEAERVQRMFAHYEQLLRSVVADPAQRIGELELLGSADRHQLLSAFNNTAMPYPRDKSVPDLFNEQVRRDSEATALVFEKQRLTYKELDERSNQVAHYLLQQGIDAEALVPLCVERSVEMIVGMLGILKAGGAYVPIDASYPLDRIGYMLKDTGAKLVLSSRAASGRLPLSYQGEVILLDEEEGISNQRVTATNVTVLPKQLAYVIYTSGSTGRPKGVMVEHTSVVNLSLSQGRMLQIKAGTKVLQFAPLAFDASCYETFNTLLNGGSLVLCQKDDLLSPERFVSLMNAEEIELVVLPPSYQFIVDDSIRYLKTIVSAGEPLSRKLATQLIEQGKRLINAYGPTENTVCATFTDRPLNRDLVTIGKPIDNVRIYMLDGNGALSPVGVPGEMYIGGAQVARGYLNREELTAEKFVPDPFSSEPGALMYRTGDRARWLADGNIEFLGRMDDQIKIRGHRIELGEIDAVLLECSLVHQAVVTVLQSEDGNKQLAAYIVPQGPFNKEGIINYLQLRLPEYMIPSKWVELKSMPLTPNGKIDKKKLSEQEANLTFSEVFGAPRSNTEEKLIAIWQELLEKEMVGIHDNFFELGGHSLLAVRAIILIRNEFSANVSIKEIFQFVTIAELAEYIDFLNTPAKPELSSNSGMNVFEL